MYLDFYHLNRKPFHVTPDPEFLYLSPSHREALASIVYGVEERKGIIKITGEVGTGKTTILRSYLGQIDPERKKTAYVFNPNVSFPALLKCIFQELGIVPKSGETHEMITQFHMFLVDEYKKANTVILVIDEAQNMPVETLENLRLLSNLETTTDKLLQLVLCGQPELESHLGRKEMRQLRQRIAVRANLSPLSRKESLEYIRHRLSKASSGETETFTAAALARIVRKANGNPRVINILCDNALITGYGYQEKKVSSRTAREVIADLEGKSSLKSPAWRVAGLSFMLLLTAGYWVYTTTGLPFLSQNTTRIENPPPPGQLLDNPAVPRAEAPAGFAGGRETIPHVPGALQIESKEDMKPVGYDVKEPLVTSRLESPVSPTAGRETNSPVSGVMKEEERKSTGRYAEQEGKPVKRADREGDNLWRLAEDIYGFNDQAVLNRIEQQHSHIQDIILPWEKSVITALAE